MHDTAFHIGCLTIDIYADVEAARILELGSANVNGSLRDHALPSTHYVGVDLEPGEGVDFVATAGQPLQVEDEAFDLVIASSVLEHDAAFWVTFLEMCQKTKPGGYVYINVPSNGPVHRFPEDHWRFYPDASLALVRWAQSQGVQMTLVESFIAGRKNDVWNDFVAIFRKGVDDRELPKLFVSDQVTSWNVRTWKSDEVLREQDMPEDLILLRQANDEQTRATGELALATEAVALADARLAERWGEIAILTDMVLDAEKNAESKGASAENRRKLNELSNELVLLSGFLRDQEDAAKVAEENAQWLRDLHLVLSNCPGWWSAMPKAWQERKRDARVKRRGLFDGPAYHARYPDVAREGLNPLVHYIQHGQAEGRKR